MTPFDRERPPWEAVLVTGLEGGQAAYVLKVHHSLADGVGLTQILGLLHSPVREHIPDKPDYPVLRREAPSRLTLTTSRAAGLVRGLPSSVFGALPAASSPGRCRPWRTDRRSWRRRCARPSRPPCTGRGCCAGGA